MCYIAIYDVTIPFLFPYKTPQRFIWNGQFNVVNIILFQWNLPLISAYIDVNHVINRTFQRHRCCGFDSPGLPNDSVGYPGLAYVVRVTMPSVLRFLSVTRHESPHYNYVFSEKAQHLWRWIPLRMLTQGRLIPRQPWAIKRTTPTALHHKGIHNAKHNHRNIATKPTALHRHNIHNAKYILSNIDINSTALRGCNIHNGKHIHK